MLSWVHKIKYKTLVNVACLWKSVLGQMLSLSQSGGSISSTDMHHSVSSDTYFMKYSFLLPVMNSYSVHRLKLSTGIGLKDNIILSQKIPFYYVKKITQNANNYFGSFMPGICQIKVFFNVNNFKDLFKTEQKQEAHWYYSISTHKMTLK